MLKQLRKEVVMKKNNKKEKVAKPRKKFSLFSFFFKVFVFLFVIGVGAGAYLVYTVSKETPVDLICSCNTFGNL